MQQPASQGNKPPGVIRRDFIRLFGFATLAAFAPLALTGEARSQTMAQAQRNLAIEPVSLPDMALGPRNAPVTIVDYSSMTCSHCAAFMTNVFPQVRSKYVDTGYVRFVFREFPLDTKAAAASMLARTIAGGAAERYFGAIDSLFPAAGSADCADHRYPATGRPPVRHEPAGGRHLPEGSSPARPSRGRPENRQRGSGDQGNAELLHQRPEERRLHAVRRHRPEDLLAVAEIEEHEIIGRYRGMLTANFAR